MRFDYCTVLLCTFRGASYLYVSRHLYVRMYAHMYAQDFSNVQSRPSFLLFLSSLFLSFLSFLASVHPPNQRANPEKERHANFVYSYPCSYAYHTSHYHIPFFTLIHSSIHASLISTHLSPIIRQRRKRFPRNTKTPTRSVPNSPLRLRRGRTIRWSLRCRYLRCGSLILIVVM